MLSNIYVVVIALVVTVLVFLAIREVICWYYKINKMVELLEKQNQLLEEQINLLKNK